MSNEETEDEEECIPCEMTVAAGIILQHVKDEKKKQELTDKFLRGEMTIKELLDIVNVKEEIKEWIKSKVPIDKTLAEVV